MGVAMDNEERAWFHLIAHTYGSWLHGDPRGFRTRHHREHVEGEYKNPPPPGTYDEEYERSRKLLKQEPVVLAVKWRSIVGAAVRDKLITLGAQVLAVSMGATHAHVLAKMPPGPVPREWVGRAKKHSNFVAKDHGWTGKLWAVRGKVTPIKDRAHQLNTFHYILKHVHEGAWVWDFRTAETSESPPSPGTAVPGLSTEAPR
jgi:hypothetical protein